MIYTVMASWCLKMLVCIHALHVYYNNANVASLQYTSTSLTNVNPTDSVISKMAVGYEPDGSVAPLYDLGWVGPAGQMFSTTTDLKTVSIGR